MFKVSLATINSIFSHQPAADMDSNLYKTIKSGKIDGLKQILSAAYDDDIDLPFLHQTTPLKNTILHVAMQFERYCFEEIYIRCPSLLNQANSKGDTPLHIAARLGFTNAVSFFINQSKINPNDIGDNKDREGAAVNNVSSTLTPVQQLVRMRNEENDTALHEAVRNHNFQIVKILTEADPSFEYFVNKAGETPLYLAVEATLYVVAEAEAEAEASEDSGLFNFAHQILQTCPSSAHYGPFGRTALHIAAMEEIHVEPFRRAVFPSVHTLVRQRFTRKLVRQRFTRKEKKKDIISLLLEKKPSIIKEVDDFGLSALHYAAHYHNVGQVVQLLEADPSVAYIGDKNGKTALHYAVKYERNKNGKTALHYAVKYEGIDTIERLIKHSPDCWELLDNKGRNFLHVAAENGIYEVFEHFMSNNSHQRNNKMMKNLINQPDINGDTPLHLAIKSEWYNTAKIICKCNGVGKMAMNKDNLTALNLVDPVVDTNNYSDLYRLDARESCRTHHIHEDVERTDEKKRFMEAVRKISETHLVVAALIATVTFAAGFTLPGGYISDGPHEGMAVLIRKPAFVAFMISDSTAMLLSTFAVFVHFWAKLLELFSDCYAIKLHAMSNLFLMALLCTFGATIAMVVAFVTGTFTVLQQLPGLAIPLGIFGCSFFVFCGLLFYKLKKWVIVKA